jgi:hypothetical protein
LQDIVDHQEQRGARCRECRCRRAKVEADFLKLSVEAIAAAAETYLSLEKTSIHIYYQMAIAFAFLPATLLTIHLKATRRWSDLLVRSTIGVKFFSEGWMHRQESQEKKQRARNNINVALANFNATTIKNELDQLQAEKVVWQQERSARALEDRKRDSQDKAKEQKTSQELSEQQGQISVLQSKLLESEQMVGSLQDDLKRAVAEGLVQGTELEQLVVRLEALSSPV